MDSFLKKGPPKAKKNGDRDSLGTKEKDATSKTNFLSAATAALIDDNKDVGLDILGDMKDNLENVMEFFDLIKEADNVKGEIQQLQFPAKFPVKEYRLIEVDNALADAFQKGQKLVFRGDVDDTVVLCSENRSYAVKEVETSNSLLLAPVLRLGQDITDTDTKEKYLEKRFVNAISHHYLELKPIECVSVFRLRDMLHENELQWDWSTSVSQKENVYTWDNLLDTIQMSEGELRAHLAVMPVIEHEGHIRWLSYEYRDRLIDQIIDFCDEDSVPDVCVDKVTFDAMRAELPSNVTDEAIRWFIRTCCEEIEGVLKMLPRQVVRLRASQILRKVSKLDSGIFEQQLDQLLPTGIELKYEYLHGLCLIGETFRGKSLSYLNVEDLPEEPRERLKILFERKQSWLMEELAPYLSDICANSKAISGLLVAHCRYTKNENGDKVFCSLRVV